MFPYIIGVLFIFLLVFFLKESRGNHKTTKEQKQIIQAPVKPEVSKKKEVDPKVREENLRLQKEAEQKKLAKLQQKEQLRKEQEQVERKQKEEIRRKAKLEEQKRNHLKEENRRFHLDNLEKKKTRRRTKETRSRRS